MCSRCRPVGSAPSACSSSAGPRKSPGVFGDTPQHAGGEETVSNSIHLQPAFVFLLFFFFQLMTRRSNAAEAALNL